MKKGQKKKRKKLPPYEQMATRVISSGEVQHEMATHFAWFAAHAMIPILERLEARIGANIRTADLHPDSEVGVNARARVQAYRVAVDDVMAELNHSDLAPRLSLLWWIEQERSGFTPFAQPRS